MISARFWYNQTEYYDVTSIWDLDMDGKSVSGVDYWVAEGGSFSFGCELDDSIRWLMNRERTEPNTYQIKHGIRRCCVEILRDGVTIAEGYLQADSFKINDHGDDVANNRVETVSIRVYDLLSSVIEIIKSKKLRFYRYSNEIDAGSVDTTIWVNRIPGQYMRIPTMVVQILQQCQNIANIAVGEADIFINWLAINNLWVPVPDYGYYYDGYLVAALELLTDAVEANGLYGDVIIHKDYMTIETGEFCPRLTIVRYDAASIYTSTYHEFIHLAIYNIIGGTAMPVIDIVDRSVDVDVLLSRYGQPPLMEWELINSKQTLVTDAGRLNIINNELLFTGETYLDRIQITDEAGAEYNAGDVLNVLLNILYAYLDTSGHVVRIKNRTAWDWQSVPIEITAPADLEAQSMVNEIEYKPEGEWLGNRDAILNAINQYYQNNMAGVLSELTFGCTDGLSVGDYIRVRGWKGYVTAVKPEALSPIQYIRAIGYQVDTGAAMERVELSGMVEMYFVGEVGVRTSSLRFEIVGRNVRGNLVITAPTILYEGGSYQDYWLKPVHGELDWAQSVTLTPNAAGFINEGIDVSFLPSVACTGMAGNITVQGPRTTNRVSVSGDAIGVAETPAAYFDFDPLTGTIIDFYPTGLDGLQPLITDVVVPQQIDGVDVTAIGDYAFNDYAQDTLTSVVVQDGVVSIGYRCFAYCDALISASLADSITFIDDETFRECINLTDVNIPAGLTAIPDYFLNGCIALEEMVFPDTVESLGNFVMLDCTSLTSVSFGSGLTSIPAATCEGCTALATVIINASVLTINQNAFYGDPVEDITIGAGVTIANYTTVMGTNGNFRATYIAGGSLAGQYLWTGGAWVKQ